MRNWLIEMLRRLTDNYSKDENTNIAKILRLVSEELTDIETAFLTIEEYRDLDKATGATLDKMGSNVLQFRGQTTDEVYRVLIKAKVKRNLSDGSLNTICDVVSFLLGTDVTAVKLQEKWLEEPAAILVSVPPDSLNTIGLSFQQFSRIINKVTAGGVAAYLEYEGTFSFSSSYDQSEIDHEKGFADDAQTTGGYFGAYYDPGDDVVLPW